MKKKILILNTKDKLAGAQSVSIGISDNLKDDFEFIYFFGREGDGTLSKYLDNGGFSYIRSKYISRDINIKKDVKLLFEFYKILKDVKPDIVHANSVKPGLLVKIFSFLNKLLGYKTKYVYHHHGLVRAELYGQKAEKIFLFTEKLLNGFLDMSIYISSFDIEYVKKRGALAKSYNLVANGINYDKFYNMEYIKNKINDKINIAFFARIDIQKQPLEFVDIVSKFKDEVRIIIIGDGILKDDMIQKLNESEIEYEFVGWTTTPQLYLSKSDIVINTSITEGFPLALVEAGMSGNIVIASNIDGNNEVKKYIDDIEIYKSIEDAQNIISTFIEQKDIMLTIKKSTQNSAKKLSSKNMAKKFKTIYNSLLGE